MAACHSLLSCWTLSRRQNAWPEDMVLWLNRAKLVTCPRFFWITLQITTGSPARGVFTQSQYKHVLMSRFSIESIQCPWFSFCPSNISVERGGGGTGGRDGGMQTSCFLTCFAANTVLFVSGRVSCDIYLLTTTNGSSGMAKNIPRVSVMIRKTRVYVVVFMV